MKLLVSQFSHSFLQGYLYEWLLFLKTWCSFVKFLELKLESVLQSHIDCLISKLSWDSVQICPINDGSNCTYWWYNIWCSHIGVSLFVGDVFAIYCVCILLLHIVLVLHFLTAHVLDRAVTTFNIKRAVLASSTKQWDKKRKTHVTRGIWADARCNWERIN